MPGRNGAKTRRSGRVTLRVPLRIYEPASNQRFLVEEATAVKVSLWGGLVALTTAVNPNQKLFLANQATGETAESNVVYLGPMQLGVKTAKAGRRRVFETTVCFLGHGLCYG